MTCVLLIEKLYRTQASFFGTASHQLAVLLELVIYNINYSENGHITICLLSPYIHSTLIHIKYSHL